MFVFLGKDAAKQKIAAGKEDEEWNKGAKGKVNWINVLLFIYYYVEFFWTINRELKMRKQLKSKF